MTLLKATYVQLRGVINIAGRSAGNLDASRDECVLHLHEETGGVFVTYARPSVGPGTSPSEAFTTSHYLPPMAVESVDLAEPVGAKAAPSPASAPAPSPASDSSLADDVLAEFGEGADAKPNPKRRSPRK